MTHKPNVLEKAFDHLSAFPYLDLKRVLKRLWWFQLFFIPAVYALVILSGDSEAIKKALTFETICRYVLGSFLFGYMFYLWDKRDRERVKLKEEKKT